MSHLDASGERVADAPSGNWVYRMLPRVLWPYAQLARWDRPIGWQLLLWPCLWSAALAAEVQAMFDDLFWPRFVWHCVLFTIGAIAMRGAGCTYNDLVDHKIDASVARTRSRPLPSRRVSRFQAKLFIVCQALVGLLVLVQFNVVAIGLGVFSLVFVAIYPFAKRFTDWPQFFLGLAFSWGAIMGWVAAFAALSPEPLFLYAGAILWTISYDTIYAHQDKEDDALIGVRSTALLFGKRTKAWLVGIDILAVVMIATAFVFAGAAWPAWVGLACGAGLMGWQVVVLDIDDADQCLRLFKSNFRFGLVLFVGLVVGIFAM
ncbi:4-hydroxybenzoate octaprenyltransferase [Pararhizobium mangrovi]|uniref:4-hydroxybenzoate octaprenyltransferase n=1 Tax=Pararhizobium mangrovi TaxID=2590452 RepID=A0A506TYD1_9HYPH|nr:4-hydroxybenzoate octaprenyltransferase [Pararhizobium mangrovi]TPW26208.1 4-hydroxybenzoate octaprenyltransferase [Pararhizobium mangrovi]